MNNVCLCRRSLKVFHSKPRTGIKLLTGDTVVYAEFARVVGYLEMKSSHEDLYFLFDLGDSRFQCN